MCIAIELLNIVHHDFQQICSYNDSPSFFSVNGVTLLRVDLLFYGSGRKIFFKKIEEYYSSGKRDMIHWNCSGILDFVELATAEICTE